MRVAKGLRPGNDRQISFYYVSNMEEGFPFEFSQPELMTKDCEVHLGRVWDYSKESGVLLVAKENMCMRLSSIFNSSVCVHSAVRNTGRRRGGENTSEAHVYKVI